MSYGYLGPAGTFTEQAAIIMSKGEVIVPYHSIWDVLDAVNKGETEYGIVPIENSTEGTVNTTVDSLIFDTDLYIQSQIILPIKQNLMVKKGTDIGNLRRILSHPQALAQCRYYLQNNFAEVDTITTSSTAEAARMVANSQENLAAISPENAAELYGLEIVEKSIQDNDVNFTQFILVSRNDTSEPKSGYKTSISFSTRNEPGSLYKLLDIFSIWDVNMSRIVSRPMRDRPMEYVFFIDLDDNENPKDLSDALTMIQRKTSFFKNLGSYPVYDYR